MQYHDCKHLPEDEAIEDCDSGCHARLAAVVLGLAKHRPGEPRFYHQVKVAEPRDGIFDEILFGGYAMVVQAYPRGDDAAVANIELYHLGRPIYTRGVLAVRTPAGFMAGTWRGGITEHEEWPEAALHKAAEANGQIDLRRMA